ncbi:cell division protein FtsL [Devosia sp.]|uniref:cell division protein FtsL n=1 Tax=Devosia sp. TaxID=1871048 RepID=UPI002F09602E
MIRTLNLFLVATSLLALVGVYALKYAVEDTASERGRLERLIERQEGQLSLLKADWAYLNQPAHVAPIVTRHQAALGLAPADQKQFGSFESLPMRPVAKPDTAALDALFESLDAGVDPIQQLIEMN